MLPGKKFTPEDLVQIAWRRRWYILVPFVVVALGTAVVASRLPELYRAETLILVVPQRVPDAYVRSTVSTPNERENNLRDRLEPVKQQVLSRSRLERLIVDLNLYPGERAAGGIMEDIVVRMRKDVLVDVPLRGGDSFRIAFTYADRTLARDVVNGLASAFIDASNQDRTSFAEATTNFLGTQLEDARRRLEEVEKQLADYKVRHAGELPTERDANLQVIASTQSQLQQVAESINRDRDLRYLRERTLAELTAEVPPPVPAPPAAAPSAQGPAAGVTGQTATEQLAGARASLRQLQLRFKPTHPDVQRMQRIIADLEVKAQQEALEKPVSGEAVPVPTTPAELQRQNRIRDLRLEIEGIDRVIVTKQDEERALRARIAEYQRRVEATPARESELTGLLRDYETVQNHYASLLSKQEDSKIAENLERRQVGERFRTLDQAQLPQRPISPNRPLINLIGALVGLGLGVGFVGLLEYQDNSLRTEDEVVRLMALPVVAVVPALRTSRERRRRRRLAVLASVVSAVVLVAALATLWLLTS
jgi:polysaccharide chain length determinant protein (PEP-CTERM system associated)